MITTEDPLTLYLAVAIGVYVLAAAAAGFVTPYRWREIVAELRKSSALTFMGGVIALPIGATVIMIHHRWDDPLAVVVTLIGWLAAIEGLLLIAYPKPLLAIADRLLAPGNQRITEVVASAIGLFLTAMGLTGSVT